MDSMKYKITPETADMWHPDSPLLTAYESGVVRYLQGLKCPAGATRDLTRGYWDAALEWPEMAGGRE